MFFRTSLAAGRKGKEHLMRGFCPINSVEQGSKLTDQRVLGFTYAMKSLKGFSKCCVNQENICLIFRKPIFPYSEMVYHYMKLIRE